MVVVSRANALIILGNIEYSICVVAFKIGRFYVSRFLVIRGVGCVIGRHFFHATQPNAAPDRLQRAQFSGK